MDGGDRTRQVATSGTVALLLRLAGRAVGYLFVLVVARASGPESWGVFSLTLAVISIGSILALSGFDTAIVKLVGSAEEHVDDARTLRRLAVLTVLQGVVVTGLLWAVVPWIAEHVFGNARLTTPFRVGVWAIVPVGVLSLIARALTGRGRIALSVWFEQVLRMLVPLLVFAGLWWLYPPVDGEDVVWAYVVGNALLVLAIWKVSRAEFGRAEPAATPVRLRVVYALSLPLLLASSVGFVKAWVDTLLVGVYLDEASVGIYDVCFKLASVISIPLWAAGTVAGPLAAAAATREDADGVREASQSSAALALVLGLPVAIVLLAFPEWVLRLFGAEFARGELALRWLAGAYLVNAWAGVGGVIMTMTGLHKSYQVVVVTSTLLGIILNIVLIPRFGLAGAGASTFIAIVLFNAVVLLLIRIRWGVWGVGTPAAAVQLAKSIWPDRTLDVRPPSP